MEFATVFAVVNSDLLSNGCLLQNESEGPHAVVHQKHALFSESKVHCRPLICWTLSRLCTCESVGQFSFFECLPSSVMEISEPFSFS